MKNVFPDIIEHFKSRDWNFTQDEGRPVLRMGYSGENGEWRCVAALEREETQFAFLSFFPCKAPLKLRRNCSELLTRINYRLSSGGFEMDWSDGEILMKTSVLFAGKKLADEIIDQVVGLNLVTMDHYFSSFMKVLYTGAKPEHAVEEADKAPEVRPRFELN